jgi:signal transduction histidine kinase
MLDSSSSPAVPPLEDAKTTGGNILIVDDTPENLLFLATLLTDAGYAVRNVLSGQMAISAAQAEVPDLVLLDIVMPGMSGYKVCEILKASEITRNVPVIFLSALDEELDKVQAFQIGGVDYITKPFQMVEVLARIETHLKIGRLQAQLQQQNARLQQEINSRAATESAMQKLNQGIEAKIQERMTVLRADNAELLQQKTNLEIALTEERHHNSLKAQQQFLLSRELQTAIAAVQIATQRLLNRETPRSQQDDRHLAIIEEAAERIMQLLQKTCSVPLASSLAECRPIAIDLTQFCRELIEQFSAAEPSHQLSFVPWGKAPGKLLIDPILLQQALHHLLNNATRYSPEGGTVLLELFYEPAQLILRVRDEGIGIPAEEQSQVFTPFYRASNAALSPFPVSSGIGLTLAKQAIELHQGTIELQSDLNQGTTVTLTLPLTLPT